MDNKIKKDKKIYVYVIMTLLLVGSVSALVDVVNEDFELNINNWTNYGVGAVTRNTRSALFGSYGGEFNGSYQGAGIMNNSYARYPLYNVSASGYYRLADASAVMLLLNDSTGKNSYHIRIAPTQGANLNLWKNGAWVGGIGAWNLSGSYPVAYNWYYVVVNVTRVGSTNSFRMYVYNATTKVLINSWNATDNQLDFTSGRMYIGISNGNGGTTDGYYMDNIIMSEIEALGSPAFNITLNSIYPSDLTDISLFSTQYFNISYKYNNSNMSNPSLSYALKGPLSCYQYLNGSCILENNSYVTAYPSVNVSDGIGSLYINYSLSENDIYSTNANLNSSYMNVAHNVLIPTSSDYVKQSFLNVSNVTQYNILEVMMNTSGSSRVYACNSSYSTSNPTTNQNCQELGIISITTFNHSHGTFSKHNLVPFNIINGRIGGTGIKVTSNMSFLFRGGTGTTNVYYVSTMSRTNATMVSVNNGNTYVELLGTINAHIHQYTGSDYLFYSAIGFFNGGNFQTAYTSELIDVSPLQPSQPTITIPNYNIPVYNNFTSGSTVFHNYTYSVGGYNSVEQGYVGSTFPIEPLPSSCNLSNKIIISKQVITGGMFAGTYWYCVKTDATYQLLDMTTDELFLIFNGTPYYPQDTRFQNVTFTPATSNTVGGSISRYVGYILNNDLSVNKTIFNQTTTNASIDIYGQNLSVGNYYTRVVAYDSTGLTSYDEESFRLLTNTLLNITATNISGSLVSTFNSTINGVTYYTTNGFINYDGVIGTPYNILSFATGYGYTISNFTTPSSYYLINLTFYPPNSVNITIRDEITGAILNSANTSIVFSSPTIQYTYTTATGNLLVSNLTPDVYVATFTYSNYSIRSYTITITPLSTQNLNVYLSPLYQTTTFTYIDSSTGTPLSNVSATMYGFINGTLQPISSQISDPTGRIQWTFRVNTPYTFYSIGNGYQPKTFALSPAILFTAYNVPMTKSSGLGTTDDLNIYYTPKVILTNNVTNMSIYFNSPNGLLETYAYTLISSCYSNSDSGVNANGQVFLDNFNIGGCTDAYMYLTTSYTTSTGVSMTNNYIIPIRGTISNYTFLSNEQQTFGMGVFERVLIVTIITLVVSGVASIFGGLLAGLIIGMLIMAYFGTMGFIPITTMLIPLTVGFILFMSKGVN